MRGTTAQLIAPGGVGDFKAGIYQDFTANPDRFILTYAGTDDLISDTYNDNAPQDLGDYSPQYQLAMELADALIESDLVNGNYL